VTNPKTGAQRPARAALALAILASLAASPASQSASADGGQYTTNCPKPEPLVTGTDWHRHTLTRGVVLREGQRKDARGYVDLHVLSVDMTVKRLRFRPLVRRLAMRTKLSALAHGRPRLVAATNTGYFDFRYGTPSGPVVYHGAPLLASTKHQTLVGFNADHRVQAGDVWLTGKVTGPAGVQPLAGLNKLWPDEGLTAYTPKWGSERIPLPRDAIARYVAGGVVKTGWNTYSAAPTAGFLLVARGTAATTWLRNLKIGDKVTMSRTLGHSTRTRFTQGYAVGAQIVTAGGHARSDLKCRRSYPTPARTAIGFANHGRRLIIAAAADHPGTDLHGLDSNQMARFMADLGAGTAYLFDGSGSTEVIARMPRTHLLSLRNYPADGGPDNERTMPVGLGIFR
jgi:hypothetical protein